jgi:hypothetical protein
MIQVHSQGLALFEGLHGLLECCKALAQKQWELTVLDPSTIMGWSQGAAMSHPIMGGLKPLPPPARPTSSDGSRVAKDSPEARTSGDGADGGVVGKLKRVFSWGRKSSFGSTNRVFPAVAESDPVGVPIPHEALLVSAGHHAETESGSENAVRRRFGLHLSWVQFAVLERQRKLLMQLRWGMDGGRSLDAHTYAKSPMQWRI